MPTEAGVFPFGTPDYRSAFPGQRLDMPLIGQGGISIQRNPITLNEHSHTGYELHIVQRGAMPQITSTGERLAGRGGDVTLTQPGVLHRGEDDIIPKSEILWLVIHPQAPAATRHTPFSQADLRRLQKDLRACGNRCLPAGEATLTYYETCARSLAAHDAEPDNPYPLWELRGALCGLVSSAVKALINGESETPHYSDATTQSLAYMAAHLDTTLAIEELADLVDLSPSRFYTVFKQDTGLTPADHHLRMRIAASRLVLTEQRAVPIAEIAANHGFASARHFATTFKRFTGTTPTKWRGQA